jgi:hypothetical protein
VTHGRLAKHAALAAAGLLILSAPSGCGEAQDATRALTGPTATPKADTPATLPRGWALKANGPSGFSVGVPPSWIASQLGSSTTLSSPDRLVVVSITADRTNEALRAPLTDLATQTAAHLSGFRDLQPQAPSPFKARYEALRVAATATRASNERQILTLIVMRADGAVFSLLAAATERLKPSVSESIAAKIARTLRYRPVEVS